MLGPSSGSLAFLMEMEVICELELALKIAYYDSDSEEFTDYVQESSSDTKVEPGHRLISTIFSREYIGFFNP
jgi:hypothetical protein